MGHRKYLNAADVLPDDLLDQILDQVDGHSVYLWLPSRENIMRRHRNRYIQKLASDGISATEIAKRLCVSERHVWRILKKQRAASHSSLARTKENCS